MVARQIEPRAHDAQLWARRPNVVYGRHMLAEIWRYPIKSCAGEALQAVAVSSTGLDCDRSWAVVDSDTGLVASAKRPSLWGGLLAFRAAVEGQAVVLELPDGMYSTDDLSALEGALSSELERRVVLRRAEVISSPTLERNDPDMDALNEDGRVAVGDPVLGSLGGASPEGTVFDFAPVHLISTSTLAVLERAGGPTAGDLRRFRPNLVLDVDGPAFQENDWPGRLLAIGTELVVDVMIPSPRCIVPSLPQAGLSRSPSTLRGVASLNRIELEGHGVHSCAGVYAAVHQPGSVAVGAEVSLR